MNTTWIFFGPQFELTECLRRTIAERKLWAAQVQSKLRLCCAEHVRWMEEN